MSDIKKLLEAHQGDFISLHDLLIKMQQQGGGCTLKEAATVLYRLVKANSGIDAPSWYRSDINGVVDVSIDSENQIELIKQIAITGKFEIDDELAF